MHKSTSQVLEALCNLKNVVIKWPNKDAKKKENMQNDTQKGFLNCMGKVDGTDIILKNKLGSVYNGKIFFI